MTRVAVVYASRFVAGNSQKFQSYVDYIDRSSAVRSAHVDEFNIIEYDGYNHYMGNPEKTSALFSSAANQLTDKQKGALKDQFKKAQTNDSVMWQDVISFDNEWLEKYGLYDPKTGILDESRIMDSVRLSMRQILEREGMSQSAVWSGAIHYNTQHFHVHIAVVEPEPTREYGTFRNRKTGEAYTARRGYRSQTYLSEFRSKIANHLVDRDLQLGKINSLLREKIHAKDTFFQQLPDRKLKIQMEEIRQELPRDLRLWKYNMNALQEIRPKINQFIDTYLESYHAKDMDELRTLLKEEAAFRKELYGDGDKQKGRWKDTETNKIDELYSRLGNELLKELLEQEKAERANHFNKNGRSGDSTSLDGMYSKTLSSLKRAFSRNMNEVRLNQQAYNRMQREIEQEKQQHR